MNRTPRISQHSSVSRRTMLQHAAGGFGAIALAGLLSELQGAERSTGHSLVDPLSPRPPQLPARAKRAIFIFLNGGASHIETFDHKPRLYADAGKTVSFHEWQGQAGKTDFFLKRPQWDFKPGGRSGIQVSDLFPYVRDVVDDLCILNSLRSDHTNHYEATLQMHTGSFTFARPSIGAWLSYGLGSVNRNLPSFVVLTPSMPYAGTQTWGSDFLPGCHQGTLITPSKEPISNLKSLSLSKELQDLELNFIARANQHHLEARVRDDALDARIRSFETAFGMQQAAPDVFDLSKESDATLNLYGLKRGQTTGFGWQCLVARRFAERDVRFIELIHSNWDHHGDMALHADLAREVDQPVAGLIRDLKSRGMLDDTLVVFTTEFGRTPHHKDKNAKGREHHHQVFSSWLAGGGVRAGTTFGQSDEHGIEVAENPVHIHDFHATLLHLLGLDHERLIYRYAGRDYRLTDVHGKVMREIFA